MNKFHISLNKEEEELVDDLDLRRSIWEHVSFQNRLYAPEAWKLHKYRIPSLIKSLCERDAIPEVRLKYWLDPDYKMGGIKDSRKGIFERNGTYGDAIYMHPHFCRHLRYFLFGADLPNVVITKFKIFFKEKFGNKPKEITSDDILPLVKCARKLARQNKLDKKRASKEFFMYDY